jgi:hypothetical protein
MRLPNKIKHPVSLAFGLLLFGLSLYVLAWPGILVGALLVIMSFIPSPAN